MPAIKRIKSKYPGVFHIESKQIGCNKHDKVFYMRYKKDGKLIEEKAGRVSQGMTAPKAAQIRARRVSGKSLNNRQRREQAKRQKEQLTISKLWELYKQNNQKNKALNKDQNRFDRHLVKPFGSKRPEQIEPIDIEKFRTQLEIKLSPSTVRSILELLRRVINYGANKGLSPALTFTIQMPKVDNGATEFLNPEQLKNLMKAIEQDSHKQAGNVMKLVLFTGMRKNECFKLKWEHLDFQNDFIMLENAKNGKNNIIPMNESAKNLLLSVPKSESSSFVFPGRSGKKLTSLHKPINKIKKAAGLPENFRPLHGLRHTYASLLASSGKVDLYTIQKLLCHSKPSMTQRYSHLRDKALKDASNLIGDLVNGQTENK